jgi:hypothetical protein
VISVFRAPDSKGRDAVALVLSQDAVFLNVVGEPMTGVALSPIQARKIARRLLWLAQEIERTTGPHESDS